MTTISPVLAVECSGNAKLGACSATYVTQASCPDCVFKSNGCYAEYGPLRFLTYRVNASPEADPYHIARAEEDAVLGLTGDHPLRLHVVGDCRTGRAARVVSRAADRYRRRRGSPVWTYTHAWRAVPRRDWGGVSVLASCETPGQAVAAMDRGYAASVVVPCYERVSAYDLADGDDAVRVIPCPYQTRRVQCRDCRLCWDDRRLLAGRLVIAFAAHGAGANRVRRSLPMIDDPVGDAA